MRRTPKSAPSRDALLQQGRVWERLGRKAEAEAALRQAAACATVDPTAALALCTFLDRHGRLDEAEPLLRAFLERCDSGLVRFWLGTIHERARDIDLARQQFGLALEADGPGRLPPAVRATLQRAARGAPTTAPSPPPRLLLPIPAKDGEPANRRPKVLCVDATKRCNQSCDYCFERAEHFTRRDMSRARMDRILARGRRAGFEEVVFIGGEITLVPWLVDVLDHIRRLGLRSAIVTNGLLLDDRQFVRRLMAAGLNRVELGISSHRAEDDERVSGVESGLVRRLRALENLEMSRHLDPRPFELFVNVVLTSLNVAYLAEMLATLRRFTIGGFVLKMMVVTDNLRDASLIPRYGAIREGLDRATHWLQREELSFFCDDIPLCLIPPRFHHRSLTRDRMGGVGHRYGDGDAADMHACLNRNAGAAARCAGCALGDHCCQPEPRYVARFGDAEVTPYSAGPLRRIG